MNTRDHSSPCPQRLLIDHPEQVDDTESNFKVFSGDS